MGGDIIRLVAGGADTSARDLESADALTALKALVAEIETGRVKIEKWLLLYDEASPDDSTLVRLNVKDSALTIAEAIFMLSRGEHAMHLRIDRP